MNNYYNYARLELSHQLERVRAASSGDCSTEHSRFASVALPCRFWWKLPNWPLLGGAASTENISVFRGYATLSATQGRNYIKFWPNNRMSSLIRSN